MSRANAIDKLINWGQLPWPVDCPWYQSSKVFRIASTVLGGLGLVSGGCCYYLTKSSWVPISSRDLKICAWILGGIALLLRNLPLFGKDPAYFLQQRNQIRTQLAQRDSYGYKDMPKGYLSSQEYNLFLKEDAQAKGYGEFVALHGIEVLDVLDSENLALLKPKFCEELLEKMVQQQSEDPSLVSNQTIDKFQLTLQERLSLKVNSQVLIDQKTHLDSNNSLRRLMLPQLESLSDPRAIAYLLTPHRQKLIDPLTDVSTLSQETICLGSKDDACRQVLHDKMLRMKYRDLMESKYKKCREWLKITHEEIRQTFRARWIAVPYTGSNFEKDDFFRSLEDHFQPSEWTQKILKDVGGMSIFEIPRQFPELFEKKILSAENRFFPGQPTLAELAERAVSHCMTLELFADQCPPEFLKYRLIRSDSFFVSYLIADFVRRNPEQLLDCLPGKGGGIKCYSNAHRSNRLFSFPAELEKWREDILSRTLPANGKEKSKVIIPVDKEELKKEIQKKMLTYQIDLLLLLNDWWNIRPWIYQDVQVYRAFVSRLATCHTYPEYAKLRSNFVTFIEKAAWAGDLSLEFAWVVHAEAPNLFAASYTFTNRRQPLVNIKAFVVHAIAKKTRSLFEGMISEAFVEGQERAIKTDYDESSFDGLMEYIKTGTLQNFFKRYGQDQEAIAGMWQMADSYLLDGLKELIAKEFDIVIIPDESQK